MANPVVNVTERNKLLYPNVNERDWGDVYNNFLISADAVIASQTKSNVFINPNTFQPSYASDAVTIIQAFTGYALKIISGGSPFVINSIGNMIGRAHV